MEFCFIYMDDVIIFSKSLDEHILHLKQIFNKLSKYNLKVQLDKSEFLRKDVPFLDHIITPVGINEEKNLSNEKFPLRQKEIKSFLDLLGYYRKFIKNFAHVTKLFTQCLRKNEKINPDDQSYKDCFIECKKIIYNAPILMYLDFAKIFRLTTDASNVAIGSVISQNGKPISFFFRTLNTAERNYPTIEKELLSIVESFKYFNPYLFGKKIVIETDYKPLVWLFSLKKSNQQLIRWRLKLEEYKKGKENVVAHALSHIEVNTLTGKKNKASYGKLDDLLSVLADIDSYKELAPEDVEEPLNGEPIQEKK